MERNIALRSSLLLNHTSLRTTQNSNKYNQNSRVFHSNTSIQKRIVQPNIQNQKQVYSEKPTKKQKKDEIYNKVLYFINSLIDNPVMLSNLIKSLNFSQKNQKNLLSTTKMKDNQIFSTTNFCSNLSLDKRIENPKKKKISIQSFQSLLSSDTIQSLTSLSIEITFESDFRLNVKLLKEIFDEPSPFLIIESLCLLCKFLWKTKIILKNENCVKILIPCVILSYKILYDQQLTGMQEHFANLISSEQIQISGLEAKFLKQIEFEVEIENHQYYLVSQNVLLRGNR